LDTLPDNAESIRAKQQKNTRLNGYIDGSAYEVDFELSGVGLEAFTHR